MWSDNCKHFCIFYFLFILLRSFLLLKSFYFEVFLKNIKINHVHCTKVQENCRVKCRNEEKRRWKRKLNVAFAAKSSLVAHCFSHCVCEKSSLEEFFLYFVSNVFEIILPNVINAFSLDVIVCAAWLLRRHFFISFVYFKLELVSFHSQKSVVNL